MFQSNTGYLKTELRMSSWRRSASTARALVSARAGKFLNVCSELDKIAKAGKRNGYTPSASASTFFATHRPLRQHICCVILLFDCVNK